MSTEPPIQPLERRIYIQAQGFHLIATQNLRMGTPWGPNTALPAMVCNAFANELYLKCLIYLESGQIIKTHDLHKLFRMLKPESRKVIEERFDTIAEKSGPQNSEMWFQRTGKHLGWRLKDAIEDGAEAFVEWRYLFEDPEATKHYGLIPLPDVLREFIIERYPNFKKFGYTLKERIPHPPTSPTG